MKKLPVILLLIVVAVVSVLAFSGCVADKNRTTFLYDEKGLFSAEQVAQINEACAKTTKKYGVTMLVATTNRTNNFADMNGEQFLAAQGLSDKDDYILIIINANGYQDNYHFDLYKYGRAATRLSEGEASDAIWSIYGDYIVSNDSGVAADGVVGMLKMLGKSYDGMPLWLNIVIGVAIGLIVAGVVAARISKGYSRKRKNETYPLDKYCQMALNGHEDKFLRSTTTVVVINNSSGGGRSGGGGSHSSGGGGGGGHAGGR
ncbi:MAG: TPM domain-containing protein [Clostridia bacterium]|nr:TPM domain-containing protein [Clostridia bacterium]